MAGRISRRRALALAAAATAPLALARRAIFVRDGQVEKDVRQAA